MTLGWIAGILGKQVLPGDQREVSNTDSYCTVVELEGLASWLLLAAQFFSNRCW